MVTLRTDGGERTVDASDLSPLTVRGMRRGDRVSLFGVPRADQRLVANGFIQVDAPPPAASPRTTP
jgi:hypothetical protein